MRMVLSLPFFAPAAIAPPATAVGEGGEGIVGAEGADGIDIEGADGALGMLIDGADGALGMLTEGADGADGIPGMDGMLMDGAAPA